MVDQLILAAAMALLSLISTPSIGFMDMGERGSTLCNVTAAVLNRMQPVQAATLRETGRVEAGNE